MVRDDNITNLPIEAADINTFYEIYGEPVESVGEKQQLGRVQLRTWYKGASSNTISENWHYACGWRNFHRVIL